MKPTEEAVVPDYTGVAHVMLEHYRDRAWLIVIERITNEDGGGTHYVPFWRGVLKALDRLKGERP
jgi:hypothetical protein